MNDKVAAQNQGKVNVKAVTILLKFGQECQSGCPKFGLFEANSTVWKLKYVPVFLVVLFRTQN